MNLFSWDLQAGVDNYWPGAGKYMRILSGQGDLRVKVHYANGENIESDMLVGIGIDLRSVDSGEPFVGITFRSSQTETIKVLVSNFPTTDSRLAGDIEISGSVDTRVVNVPDVNVVNSVGTQRTSTYGLFFDTNPKLVLLENANRKKAVIQFDVAVYIGVSSGGAQVHSGIYLPAGSTWIDDNTQPLWAKPVETGSFRVMESE